VRRPLRRAAPSRARRAWAWGRRAALPAVLAAAALAIARVPAADAASARSRVEAGNTLFRDGHFAEARERYLAAQADRPDAAEIEFNIGDSFYGEGAFPNAAGIFAKSLERFQAAKKRDPALVASAAYNLGNALFKAEKADEAIESYKRALRADPTDVDAKHNLEYAMRKKEEKEQQKENQKDDQKKNKPDEDKSQKPKEDDAKEEPEKNPSQDENTPQDQEDQKKPDQHDQGAGQDSAEPPPPKPPSDQPQPGEARGMPKEDALRILEALEAQELAQAREEQMKALQRALDAEGKDW
jgi:tetratricopeptide (TPR) repeat protein